MKTVLTVPVYVYLKRHTITGKYYFGKTVKDDLDSYKGSGKRWIRHYRKHGSRNIENIFVEKFENQEDLVEFCEFFSEFYNIVDSNQFLNLIPENGLDGGDTKFAYYIDQNGNKIKRLKCESAELLKSGFVKLRSNEGKNRSGVYKEHKNKNTVAVIEKKTLITKRISKENFNSLEYAKVKSKEYYSLLNKIPPKTTCNSIKVVDDNKNTFVVTKEEFNLRSDLHSIYSTQGKIILSNNMPGNRKGMLTCADTSGTLHNISKEEFWKQLETYGENRKAWPLVHHSHPEGKRRKALKK